MSRSSDSYASGAQAALRTIKVAAASFVSGDPRTWVEGTGGGPYARFSASPGLRDLGYGALGAAGLYGAYRLYDYFQALDRAASFNGAIPPELSLSAYL